MAEADTTKKSTLSPEVRKALQHAIDNHLPTRIWQKEPEVWAHDAEARKSVETRLGWLEAPDFSLKHLPEIIDFATKVREDGVTSAVVLGMGGSSLCVEVLRDSIGGKSRCPQLYTLDSTHPDQIAELERSIDLEHTLFIVASKSGTTLEPQCYYNYFWEKLEYLGSKRAEHFAAITDPGTPLEKMGVEKGFRAVFANPPDIGGRYSALSYFGMVTAALAGIEIEEILSRASSEAGVSRSEEDRNTSLSLGVFLGEHANQGRDKLTIVTSDALRSFGYWAEQLIAESTGKLGKGILPIEGESERARREGEEHRMYVHLMIDDESLSDEDRAKPNHLELHLADKFGLGAQFFRWEFATAIAGAMMGINPFDEPNVAEAKAKTNAVLNGYDSKKPLEFPDTKGTVQDVAVAGFKTNESPSSTLDSFLQESVKADGYIAIMVYVNRNTESIEALDKLREKLSLKYHVPVTVGFGPRFLHSTGQLHKGGPNNGTFVQFVDSPKRDLDIPEKPFSFATLIRAQAIGDFETLRAHKRPVVSFDLGAASIRALRSF
jgi:transaldolase/glucose-6-phosphate isomerase